VGFHLGAGIVVIVEGIEVGKHDIPLDTSWVAGPQLAAISVYAAVISASDAESGIAFPWN
jgi:hypothetical protein